MVVGVARGRRKEMGAMAHRWRMTSSSEVEFGVTIVAFHGELERRVSSGILLVSHVDLDVGRSLKGARREQYMLVS